jgi:hypothetical protein
LELFLGNDFIQTLPRIRGKGSERVCRIDYRHIIGALIKKPQAFRQFIWREALLPNTDYELIWREVDTRLSAKEACKYMVRLLYLASQLGSEQEAPLGRYVLAAITEQGVPEMRVCKARFGLSSSAKCPEIKTSQHTLSDYDILLPKAFAQEVRHVA